MSETKRERPAAMAEWNQEEMCHWLRLVNLAEAAAMIEGLEGEVSVARHAGERLKRYLVEEDGWNSEALDAVLARVVEESTP